MTFHTVIESDLVPEKCALDPKSGLCGAQIWEESRPVETFGVRLLPYLSGVFQLLKDVVFRRILTFCNSRKWGNIWGSLRLLLFCSLLFCFLLLCRETIFLEPSFLLRYSETLLLAANLQNCSGQELSRSAVLLDFHRLLRQLVLKLIVRISWMALCYFTGDENLLVTS